MTKKEQKTHLLNEIKYHLDLLYEIEQNLSQLYSKLRITRGLLQEEIELFSKVKGDERK